MPVCIPCPAPVRHFAHHVHRHVWRPVGRVVHHVWHHAPRIVSFGCCAAAVGGLGGALVAPPGGFFAPPAAYAGTPASSAYAPAEGFPGGGSMGGSGGIGSSGGASQGWPEMPGWAVATGGIGGNLIGGATSALIPVYTHQPSPELLSVQPNVYGPSGSLRGNWHGTASIPTQVPEPSSFAVLLLPLTAIPLIRRFA